MRSGQYGSGQTSSDFPIVPVNRSVLLSFNKGTEEMRMRTRTRTEAESQS